MDKIYTNAELLGGITLGTLYSLKHSTDKTINYTSGRSDENDKFIGWVVENTDRWTPLISTKPIFDTAEEAVEYMKKVVIAARTIDLNSAETVGNLGRG